MDAALRGRPEHLRPRRRRDRCCPSGPAGAQGLPLRFDIQVTANNTLRIQNNLADIVASADLRLQGTYDRPAIFGRAEVDRGSILFEGNRYVVTRGTIDFLTPPAGSIEPLFDIEAETRVRAASQTDRSEVFRVTLGVTGTPRSFSLALGSDPPLPEVDIIALLFGATTDVSNAELRALSPSGADAAEEALLQGGGRAAARGLDFGAGAPRGRGDAAARHRADRADHRHRQRSAVHVDPADPRQAAVAARLSHVLPRARAARPAIRSSCSSTTRPTASASC